MSTNSITDGRNEWEATGDLLLYTKRNAADTPRWQAEVRAHYTGREILGSSVVDVVVQERVQFLEFVNTLGIDPSATSQVEPTLTGSEAPEPGEVAVAELKGD